MPQLVKYPEQVLENARQFSRIDGVRKGEAFDNFGSFHHWYFIPNGRLFAPAKFLGYEDTTLENYTRKDGRTGGAATTKLKKWFKDVEPGQRLDDGLSYVDLKDKLEEFARRVGKDISRNTYNGQGGIHYPRKEYTRFFAQTRASPAEKRQPDSLGHNVAPTPRAADFEEPEGPDRVPSHGYRILRDTATASAIKELHCHRCQVCNRAALRLADGRPYAEAHHLKPLGSPHDGPDVAGNIICVCPNCHALLDYFAIPLDPFRLGSAAEHRVEQEYVQYHNSHHNEARAKASTPGL
jgi:hypothetical protein